jgi:hypothetical protein
MTALLGARSIIADRIARLSLLGSIMPLLERF